MIFIKFFVSGRISAGVTSIRASTTFLMNDPHMFTQSARPARRKIAFITNEILFFVVDRSNMLIKSLLVGRHVRAKLTLKFLDDKRIKINLYFYRCRTKAQQYTYMSQTA